MLCPRPPPTHNTRKENPLTAANPQEAPDWQEEPAKPPEPSKKKMSIFDTFGLLIILCGILAIIAIMFFDSKKDIIAHRQISESDIGELGTIGIIAGFIREETTAFRRWQRSVSDLRSTFGRTLSKLLRNLSRMETTGFPGLALRTTRGTNALFGGSAEFSRWSFIQILVGVGIILAHIFLNHITIRPDPQISKE